MFVLGTAGHVDHGKSSFLRALTGMEPDRLPEEKKRGLTINLNFLWSEIPPFGKVGFIDVPGHHRFIKNMISGVGEISGFILVVAADDGWMPQTEEHVQILKAFGIHQGLVVMSKVDRVEKTQLLETEKGVRDKVNSHFGTAIEMIRFSKEDPESPPVSQDAVKKLLNTLPSPFHRNSARLFVDRAFIATGKGVITTGTLTEGGIKVQQHLNLWPAQKAASVRGLQIYQEEAQNAEPVSRVALQLSQVEKQDLPSGSLLSADPIFTTHRADVKVHFLENALKKNTQLKVLWGSLEKEALFIPGGTPSLGRIQFEDPVPLRFGDRFILRSAGGEKLLAGGWVVDPLARAKNKKEAEEILESLERKLSSFFKLEFHFEGTVCLREIFKRSFFAEKALRETLNHSDYQQLQENQFALKTHWDEIHIKTTDFLKGRSSLSSRELIQLLEKRFPAELVKAVFEHGLRNKIWEGTSQEIFPLRSHTSLSPEQIKILNFFEKKLGIFSAADLGTHFPKEILKNGLSDLVKREKLIALKDGLYCSPALFQKYQEKVVGFLRLNRQATPSQLKEVFEGLSRKYTIPLLEKMDQQRITYLKEGVRKLLK